MAVDLDGNVVASRRPTRGDGWKLQNLLEGYNSLNGVVCHPRGFCIAYDNAGNIVTSSKPRTSPSGWRVVHVDAAGIERVTCPSATLCVAYDSDSNLLVSTDPLGGAQTWELIRLAASHGVIDSLSCPSVSLCVAVDESGFAITSTNPAAGSQGWMVNYLADNSATYGCLKNMYPVCPSSLSDLSCVRPSVCVARDHAGNVIASDNPTGGKQAWRIVYSPPQAETLIGVTCASSTLCAAFPGEQILTTSTTPTQPGSWIAHRLADTITNLSCPTSSLCFGTDNGQDILWSRHPTRGAAAWRHDSLKGSADLYHVTCPYTSLCLAVDFGGHIFSSTNPTGGTRTWRRTHADYNQLSPRLACPTPSLCVAVDSLGNLLVGRLNTH